MNFFKTTLSIILIILLIGTLSGIAMASTAPVFPTVKPPASTGGGGGGGSSGGSSGPSFTPFVAPLLSSDGSTIGSLTGKTAYSVDLLASNNTTINGKNYTLTMVAELTQKPGDDTRLDIIFESPDHSGLPKGMNGISLLGMMNISKHVSSGWNLKPETVKLTFTVPGTPGSDANTTYYLVRYDGSGYYVQNVALKSSDAGTMTFEVSPGTDTGLFTLVTVGAIVPTPTPTPVQNSTMTQAPASSLANNTTSSDGSSVGVLGIGIYVIIGVLAVALAALAGILYMLYIKR